MRLILSALAFAVVLGTAQADTFRRTVPANKTSSVGANATYTRSGCTAGAIPQYKVSKKPQHGEVRFKQVTFKLSKDAGRCAGTKVKGTAIIYKPNRGYRGKDTFKVGYKMDQYVSGSAKIRYVVDRYIVEVK